MCDTQYTDEYCVCIYSEAKMHNAARVSRFLFVSLLAVFFSLNLNLGFWYSSSTKRTKNLQKKTVCCDDDDDDDDDDAEKEKRKRALLRVILLIFFDDDKKNEP